MWNPIQAVSAASSSSSSSSLSHVNLGFVISAVSWCWSSGCSCSLLFTAPPPSSLVILFCLPAAVGPIIRLKGPRPLGPLSLTLLPLTGGVRTQNTISRAETGEVPLSSAAGCSFYLHYSFCVSPPHSDGFLQTSNYLQFGHKAVSLHYSPFEWGSTWSTWLLTSMWVSHTL